ncbi:ethylene receptor 1 isoform X1 [Physcomitrium patens]|uniref:ethylene receptor 1 isoform X1 n=1 Tax=Physcomitrium patens TaxID=3218 RepID=UPI000D17AED9|nr:ethylene receptor 1-like isoform X1 [Physcomitrium patens]|eukprot:XP_024387114.1 ethylene receptor 1-like isoform X1 [Physcomitrella patens]
MCFKMKRSAVAVWVLFYGVQLMLPQGAMAVIRRRFFVGSVVGEERYAGSTQWPVLENHASAKYCVEPCTTMVLEASAQCHSCLLAHPMIPQYMQMIYWQLISDVLIALAYFSIPVELLYFIYKAQVFPYKWVVAEFGAFIVLCGLTHLINVWTFEASAADATQTMTFFKVATAFVSCATAVTLSWVIPEVLGVKKHELYLVGKTAELDKEVGVMKKKEETGKYVRMLTSEIRSSLNRHTILKTTLVELAQTLKLNNCNIWMPTADGNTFQLNHELEVDRVVTPSRVAHRAVPRSDSGVLHVLNQQGAHILPPDSLLGRHNCPETEDVIWEDRVVAVRLPYMCTSNYKEAKETDLANGHFDAGSSSYALLVLVLPCDPERKWQNDALDLVTAVASQVAVALSHATVLEESMNARDQLLSQNLALQIARMEAEEAVAARNDFLAVMNHEMRTPMHSLIALTSILLKTELNDDQHAMIETMSKSSGLLSSLINDILDFSRLEIGGLALDVNVFKLPNLMREVENIVRPLAASKRISLIFLVPRDLPEDVLGDCNRILQVMLNVIGNAIKFTLEGDVRVSVYMGDKVGSGPVMSTGSADQPLTPKQASEYRFLHVDVKDTGIGIKAMDVPRLFNKFVQADSSTTRNFGGTGLGLAISRKFVELMGGSIWLESEGLGKGTTCKMHISIGICDLNVKRMRNSPRVDKAALVLLTDLKVMVVDDNPINRIVTRRLLDTIGCKSTVLESGQKCLDVLSEKGPAAFHIILLDLCMPEMDGFTVATEILRRYGKTRRPVISALTANSDTKTRERCFATGMDYVLMKPISLELLKSELVKLLDFHEELDVPPQLDSKITDEAVLAPSDYSSVTLPQPDHTETSSSAPQLLMPPIRELHYKNDDS